MSPAECRICKLPEERDGLCPGHREEWILWAASHPWAQNEARYDWWVDARAAMVRDVGGGPCPYCDFVAHDTPDELAHMSTCHPEIVAERLSRIGERVSPESIRATAGPRVPPLDADPIIEPRLLAYTSDVGRLRTFGIANGLGDSATALRALLDHAPAVKRADTLLGALIAISEQDRALDKLPWWRYRKRRLHKLAIRDTLTVVLDEGMTTRGSRVG